MKKEALINKQERAAKQQELLEKKRKAKAEYNESGGESLQDRTGRGNGLRTAGGGSAQGLSYRAPGLRKQTEKQGYRVPKHRIPVEFQVEETSVSQWFLSICWVKIPIIGFLYAFFLAVSPGAPDDRKKFARGYLIYRCMVLLLSVTVLYILYQVGLDFVDQILAYIR